MISRTATWALALAFAAPAMVLADDLYKSTMPDGSVRYGESPAPGAKQVRKIAPPPNTTGTLLATPDQKARAAMAPSSSPSVAILPQQPRESPAPAVLGGSEGPRNTLPKRAY